MRLSAEELVALIAKDGCYFDSRGGMRMSTKETAALIEQDRRDTLAEAADRAIGYLWPDGPCFEGKPSELRVAIMDERKSL